MKKYVMEFLKRGMAFGGFGPIIAGIVYVALDFSIENFSISGTEAFTAIISTYLLAFVHAGASVFNQIEKWPIPKSLLCHMSVLYVSYALCYIVNSWIPFDPTVLLIFTAVFAAVYLVIWAIVYFIIKAASNQMNRKLI